MLSLQNYYKSQQNKKKNKIKGNLVFKLESLSETTKLLTFFWYQTTASFTLEAIYISFSSLGHLRLKPQRDTEEDSRVSGNVMRRQRGRLRSTPGEKVCLEI